MNNALLSSNQTVLRHYRKEFKLKETVYMSIYIIYEIFLLIFAICLIHTLAVRDFGCDKYVPYLILMLLGNISYIICTMLNLYATFKQKIKKRIMKCAWLMLMVGVCFKASFIIYSIVIYDRSYGDCYFPYTTQLIFMIGSFLEMIFLVFLQNFWANNEKNLKENN